jgi:hypothetical protein
MYDPEEIAAFDAYEPNDPKHPGYVDRVTDAEIESVTDDRPPMSPLGMLLFDLATTESRVIAAGLRPKEDEVSD